MSLFTFRRANSDPSRTDAWNTNGHFVVNVAGTVGTNGHCALPKTFTCANGHSGVKNTNGQGPSVPVANGPWRQTGHNSSIGGQPGHCIAEARRLDKIDQQIASILRG